MMLTSPLGYQSKWYPVNRKRTIAAGQSMARKKNENNPNGWQQRVDRFNNHIQVTLMNMNGYILGKDLETFEFHLTNLVLERQLINATRAVKEDQSQDRQDDEATSHLQRLKELKAQLHKEFRGVTYDADITIRVSKQMVSGQ